MEINPVFNWQPGNIWCDNVPPPEEKKGWFSQVKDRLVGPSLEDPSLLDRRRIAETFGAIRSGADDGSPMAVARETGMIILERSLGLKTSELTSIGFEIAVGTIAGPIGMSLRCLEKHPVLGKIAFRDQADRERVLMNSIILMEQAKDPHVRNAFPSAVEEFLTRAGEDASSPERAGAAKRILEVLDSPGITVDEKKALCRDAMKVMRGGMSPVRVYSSSVQHRNAGAQASVRFAEFLEESLDGSLAPLRTACSNAAGNLAGKERELAVLKEAKARSDGKDSDARIMAGLAALQMLSDKASGNEKQAADLLNLIVSARDPEVCAIYAEMVLSSETGLPPSLPSVLKAGKALGAMGSQGDAFGPLFACMAESTSDAEIRQIAAKAGALAGSLPPKGQAPFLKTLFDTLPPDGKIPGPLLFAKIGSSMVKEMPVEYSEQRDAVVAAAKLFLGDVAAGTGKTGETAKQALLALQAMHPYAGSAFSREALAETAGGVASIETSLAAAGKRALSAMPEEYSDQRNAKTDAVKIVLERILDSSTDDATRRLVSGALRSMDGELRQYTFRNGLAVITNLAKGAVCDVEKSLAGIFGETLCKLPEEYSDQRARKAAAAAIFLDAIKDASADPLLKERFTRAADILATVEEKVPNSKGEMIGVSDGKGYKVAQHVLESVAQGKVRGPAKEIGAIGADFTGRMSVEYSDQRERQAIECKRFFTMVEKHEPDPAKKETAAVYRELLEGLGRDSAKSLGVNGLTCLAEGKTFTIPDTAGTALTFLVKLPDEYSDQRARKTEAAKIIPAVLEKHAKTPDEQRNLAACAKLVGDLSPMGYGYKPLARVLPHVSGKPGKFTSEICTAGDNFISGHFDEQYADGRTKKTASLAAFLNCINAAAVTQQGKALSQTLALFCQSGDREKGFKVAPAAFKVIASVEENPASAGSIASLFDEIKKQCDPALAEKLGRFFDQSIGSIFAMKESIEGRSSAVSQVRQEEEFVVIDGVRLKKGKTRDQHTG